MNRGTSTARGDFEHALAPDLPAYAPAPSIREMARLPYCIERPCLQKVVQHISRWLLISLCAFLTPTSYAAVIIQNATFTANTSSTAISFQGMNIQSLTNLLTNEQNIIQPGPGWMDMSLQHSTGEMLRTGSWQLEKDPATGAQVGVISAQDSARVVTLTVGTDPGSDEVVLRFQGRAKTPGVRSMFFGLQGFDPTKGRFLLPARAGIYFDGNTNPPTLEMEYPTHWEAQFVVYETSQGGVLIYARDPKPYFKRVQASRQYGTLDLGLEVFALGPWSTAAETPLVEWRLKGFQGPWRTAVDTYRAWSDGVWRKRTPDKHRDWTEQTQSVVTIIDPNLSYLDTLARRLDPAKTLLYVANWRKDSYDVNYPDYTPGPFIGAFVDRAHQLGFHIMLHTNALGVATYNPVYQSVARYQLRDPDSGDLIYWPQGLWPAGPPPPYFIESFAFISACSSAYRSMFIEALRPMIESLKPDALHLDAGGVMLNDGNGPIEGMTSIEGMIQLHKDVSAAYPQLALSYESMTEVLAPLQDFAQRWSADYPAHPISTYLMGDRVKFYGFLNQSPPDEPGFIDYMKRYEAQGVMPTIVVNSVDDLSPDLPIASQVLNMMGTWQKHGFRPDWGGDWNGLLFRYAGEDGSTTATVENSGDVIRMKAAGQVLYERVQNTTSLQTPSFIRNWAAYDDTTLYGLDPAMQYWLDRDAKRPANAPRLSGVPSSASIGLGTLATGDYGYFELQSVAAPPFDFIQHLWEAKRGTDYGRKDYSLGAGDLVEITRTSIAGQEKNPVILMQPPGQLPGAAVFLDYEVPIPAAAPRLNFSAGLSDSGTRSDGAWFWVRINGADVWQQVIKLGSLVPVQIDLSPWAGQTVHIRFIVHPGRNLNPIDDFGCWADLSITSGTGGPAFFQVVVPDGSPNPTTGGSITLQSGGQGPSYPAQADVPAKFSVFTKPPHVMKIGGSLLDIPFDVWKMGYGGWARPAGLGPSGGLHPVVSGGKQESPALPTFPPQNGLTLVTWAAQLPVGAAQLSFKYCLSDPLPPLPATVQYSQTAFSLKVNGEQVWSQTIQTNGWNARSVDISKWAGQNVVIQVAVDALGEGTFNWGNWAVLQIH
jgi:hypothetical protein